MQSNKDEEKGVKEEATANIVCTTDNCGKIFQTFFGLERHSALKHLTVKPEKEESVCKICDKKSDISRPTYESKA